MSTLDEFNKLEERTAKHIAKLMSDFEKTRTELETMNLLAFELKKALKELSQETDRIYRGNIKAIEERKKLEGLLLRQKNFFKSSLKLME